jgi:hypothetical protein
LDWYSSRRVRAWSSLLVTRLYSCFMASSVLATCEWPCAGAVSCRDRCYGGILVSGRLGFQQRRWEIAGDSEDIHCRLCCRTWWWRKQRGDHMMSRQHLALCVIPIEMGCHAPSGSNTIKRWLSGPLIIPLEARSGSRSLPMNSLRFFSRISTDLLYILTVFRAGRPQKKDFCLPHTGTVLVWSLRIAPDGSKLLALAGSKKIPLKMGR